MKKSITLLLIALLIIGSFPLDSEARRKRFGFIRIDGKKQPVASPPATLGTDSFPGTNTTQVALGARRKFSTASITLVFKDLHDQIVKGMIFSNFVTGTTDVDGSVTINILSAKFKNDAGFELRTDDTSTVNSATVKILKINKKGFAKLRVTAVLDNVKKDTLGPGGAVTGTERVNGIVVKAKGRYQLPN